MRWRNQKLKPWSYREDTQNTLKHQMLCGISLLRGGLKSFPMVGSQTKAQIYGWWEYKTSAKEAGSSVGD